MPLSVYLACKIRSGNSSDVQRNLRNFSKVKSKKKLPFYQTLEIPLNQQWTFSGPQIAKPKSMTGKCLVKMTPVLRKWKQ